MLPMKLPAGIKNFKLYSDAEFRALKGKEHRQERLLAAVLDDREMELSDTDIRYLELLRRAYGILTDELSFTIAQKKLSRLLQVSSPARLRQITNDVNNIFCDTEGRGRALTKALMCNKLSRLIKKIEKADFTNKGLPKLYELLGRWEGMDEVEGINPDDFEIPEIQFSTNINDLDSDVEDTEFEVVSENFRP